MLCDQLCGVQNAHSMLIQSRTNAKSSFRVSGVYEVTINPQKDRISSSLYVMGVYGEVYQKRFMEVYTKEVYRWIRAKILSDLRYKIFIPRMVICHYTVLGYNLRIGRKCLYNSRFKEWIPLRGIRRISAGGLYCGQAQIAYPLLGIRFINRECGYATIPQRGIRCGQGPNSSESLIVISILRHSLYNIEHLCS